MGTEEGKSRQVPPGISPFEFVVRASLRAKQLLRGAKPKIAADGNRHTTIAQMEVAAGLIDGPQEPDPHPPEGS